MFLRPTDTTIILVARIVKSGGVDLLLCICGKIEIEASKSHQVSENASKDVWRVKESKLIICQKQLHAKP